MIAEKNKATSDILWLFYQFNIHETLKHIENTLNHKDIILICNYIAWEYDEMSSTFIPFPAKV